MIWELNRCQNLRKPILKGLVQQFIRFIDNLLVLIVVLSPREKVIKRIPRNVGLVV